MNNEIQIERLDDKSSTFELVELKVAANGKIYPYCKVHGAMNKVTDNIWRCIAAHSRTKIVIGNSVSYKENDNICRAAAKQITSP